MAAAAIIEQINEARDKAQFASHETYVELANGAVVHYRLAGAKQPGPTIVFLNGISASAEQWDGMQASITSFSPSIAYDCGGTGLSSGSSAHDAQAQSDEVVALLKALGIHGKVILVGFSMSGSLARVFAAQHPELVAGTVLLEPYLPEIAVVDPAQQKVLRALARPMVTATVESMFGLNRAALRLGIVKFGHRELHSELDFRCLAILLRFSHWLAVDREVWATEASSRQAMASFSDTPLLVYTSGKSVFPHYDDVVDQFVATHHGVLRQLDGTDHSEILNNPRSIELIIAGIEQLAVQSRTP